MFNKCCKYLFYNDDRLTELLEFFFFFSTNNTSFQLELSQKENQAHLYQILRLRNTINNFSKREEATIQCN